MPKIRKSSPVVLAGYYGFDNAGDELILMSIILQLRTQNPDVKITVLSAHPNETARQFGVKAANRWNPLAWVRVMWSANSFMLGGGGLLQESTGRWNHTFYLVLLSLAKFLGCRTEVRAIGVDSIETRWNRLWTQFVFNHMVDFVSVRDTDSQRALETIGVHTRLWRLADPVFNLEIPNKAVLKGSPPRIGWAISPWSQRPGWEIDLAHLMERVAEKLGVTNELLIFFPAQDAVLAQKIADLTSSQKVTVRSWSRPDELLTWIRDYDLIIGMRYHALVLAALAEKPFIGWGFQRKVRTFCRDFSQPVWTFERGWDADAVFRQISESWRQRESLPERYRTQKARLTASSPVESESARIFVSQA